LSKRPWGKRSRF